MKQVLFFDIDGTLAVPGQPPSKAVVEAIREARCNGHLAFLSTGRSEASVQPAVKEIGFDGGIYSAGGRVVADGKELFRQPLPQSAVQTITAALEAVGALYTYECDSGNYHSDASSDYILRFDQCGNSEMQRVMLSRMDERSSMQYYHGEPVFKINFLCPSQNEIRSVRSSLGREYTVVSYENLLEDAPLICADIITKEINKGRALRLVCRYLGITPENCIAFGDSMNDAEILQAAGTAVVMGNSDSRLRAYADMICDHCENDGVAKALNQLGIIA